MNDIIGSYLIKNGISISSVESFTVGSFANLIGSVPGISKVYRGSMVTYQTEMKHKLLSISSTDINTYGVVSEEIAYQMAKRGAEIFHSNLCVSFTGNSGPLPMENKPVGLCYIGICFNNETKVYTLHLSGNREEIKQQALNKACEILKQILGIGG